MKLEINGHTAELGDEIIAISKKGFDIDDISLRGIEVSNRINLPKVQTNTEIFNSPDIINSDNNYLNKYYDTKISDNFFLFNGIGFLAGINNKSYQFQIAEKSKELINNLNKKINELDFESEDFTFTDANYDNYKLLSSSIWVWPIVCMNETTTIANTRLTAGNNGLKYSRPMFRFKTLLEKIFTTNNWTIDYDEEILDQLAISSNAKRFYVTSYQKNITDTITVAGTQNISDLDTNDFENNVTTVSTTIDIGDTPTVFRLRGNIVLDDDFTVIFKATDTAGKINEQRFLFNSSDTIIDIFTDKFETTQVNNYLEIIIEGNGDFELDTCYLYSLIEEIDLGNLASNLLIDYRIKVYDNLPDRSQYNIFKDAILFTNSIIKPYSFNKIIYIKSLKNLTKLYNEDWSDKFVIDSEKIINKFGYFEKKNWLLYDNDSTISSLIGSDYFEIESDLLRDETNILKFDYSASIDIELSTYEMAYIKSYGLNPDQAPLIADTIRINELNDRILYIYNDPTNTFTLGRFAELDWKNLRDYWNTIFDSLLRPRLLKAKINLNELDFYEFDFTKTSYIKRLGSSFIVLDIDNFIPGKVTNCSILKFK